jgi:hypothetical protein
MGTQEIAGSDALYQPAETRVTRLIRENPYVFGLACFASLGGFLFGYDQGVVYGVLTMESFGAKFPRIYLDSGFKGWFVSSLLLGEASPLTLYLCEYTDSANAG